MSAPAIAPPFNPGDDHVCGNGRPNADDCICIVWLHPDHAEQDLGCGSSDSNGHFCVAVAPPLMAGQVIIAVDRCGDDPLPSQPELIGATPAPMLGATGSTIAIALLILIGLGGLRRLRRGEF